MYLRLILDRWRWQGVRSFERRNRIDADIDPSARAADYTAIADAFGLTWPGDSRRVHALLRRFGEPDPSAVRVSIGADAAPVTLCPVIPLWASATD